MPKTLGEVNECIATLQRALARMERALDSETTSARAATIRVRIRELQHDAARLMDEHFSRLTSLDDLAVSAVEHVRALLARIERERSTPKC